MESDGEQSYVPLFLYLGRVSATIVLVRQRRARTHGEENRRCASRHTILAIDVGGSRVKFMTDKEEPNARLRPALIFSAKAMVRKIKALTKDWSYDVVSIGYPGQINNRPLSSLTISVGDGPASILKRLGRPTKVVNDALMQAIGSYQGDRMLFLGLGTGLA